MKYTVTLTLHVSEEEVSSSDIADLVWEAVSEIPMWDDQNIIVNIEMEDPKGEVV
jgi:hypothetical protein